MAIIRAQITLPFFTAVPNDVSTNTLYFQTPDTEASPAELAEIGDRCIDAYLAIDGYLSPVVRRAANVCTVKLYDMADSEPRVPKALLPFTLGAAEVTTGLPNEVCVCMSFQANPVSGIPQGRRRGRIFLGPLTTSAVGGGSATQFPAVAVAFRTAIGNMYDELSRNLVGCEWIIYSNTYAMVSLVQQGWIDAEPDTQRRRGVLAATRTILPDEPG